MVEGDLVRITSWDTGNRSLDHQATKNPSFNRFNEDSSDSDDEMYVMADVTKLLRDAKIMHPLGRFRKIWDLLQVLLLFYVAILVPYRICFDDDVVTYGKAFFLDVLVDMYFIVDVVLNFRTAYYDTHGELKYQTEVIAAHYARTWLTIDILGCLPVNYVLLFMESQSEVTTGKNRTNKVFRILRLARLLKLLRVLRINRILRRYEEEYYALQSSFRMTKILLIVGMISHWMGCIWYFFGDEPADPLEVTPDGEMVLGWVETYFGGQANETNMNLRYVTSIYWSIMTMTTVGYGDIAAKTVTEQAVSVVCMIAGGFVFGLIIGSLSDLERKSNPAGKKQTKLIGHLSAFLSDRRVPIDTTRRVRTYFSTEYALRTAFAGQEYEDYFTQLPTTLRDELGAQLGYLTGPDIPGLLDQTEAFKGLDTKSICLICSRMRVHQYETSVLDKNGNREFIFEQGDAGHDMAVIADGTACLLPANNSGPDDPNGDTLIVGACLDEHMALLPSRKEGYYRRRSLYAATPCTIAALSSDKLTEIRRVRPGVHHHLDPFMAKAFKRKTVRKMRNVFDDIDQAGEGFITKAQFNEALNNRSRHGSNAAEYFYTLYHRSPGGVPKGEADKLYDQLLEASATPDQIETPTVVYRAVFLKWWAGSSSPHQQLYALTSEERLGNQIGEITKRNMALRKQLDAIERTLIARASATVE